jgi:hypothetical protein
MARSSLTYILGFSVKYFFQPMFGLIRFRGFRGEDLNVKFTTNHGRQVMAKAHLKMRVIFSLPADLQFLKTTN